MRKRATITIEYDPGEDALVELIADIPIWTDSTAELVEVDTATADAHSYGGNA